MKVIVAIALAMAVSGTNASANCASVTREVEADLDALGKYLETSSSVTHTKSNRPLDMVKEHLDEQYSGDYESYKIEEHADSISVGESEAGLTTQAGALGAVMDTAETWYLERDTAAAKKKAEKEIRAAARKAFSHGLLYGYDAGAQGWGGSPAVNLLLLNPQCKTYHTLFLGISHD